MQGRPILSVGVFNNTNMIQVQGMEHHTKRGSEGFPIWRRDPERPITCSVNIDLIDRHQIRRLAPKNVVERDAGTSIVQ